MNISIIGSGWVGCHLAYKLQKDNNVTIFEKNDDIFSETSYKNQNRLHIGYHYARSSKTRNLCLETFNRFYSDYRHLTKKVINNYYCISEESIIDSDTYLKIYEGYDFVKSDYSLKNVSCVIDTNELYIDFSKSKDFFKNNIKNIKLNQKIDKRKIKLLSKEYDLVIDCTNNNLGIIKNDSIYYELTLTLLYEKRKDLDFGAFTFVDGPFFSIYPYSQNLFTVTDVEYTPLFRRKSPIKIEKEKNKLKNKIEINKNKIEDKINKYLPNFLDQFKYVDYFLSTKVKFKNKQDDRYPVIVKTENLISTFTGKIQGIYVIEDFIFKFINDKKF